MENKKSQLGIKNGVKFVLNKIFPFGTWRRSYMSLIYAIIRIPIISAKNFRLKSIKTLCGYIKTGDWWSIKRALIYRKTLLLLPVKRALKNRPRHGAVQPVQADDLVLNEQVQFKSNSYFNFLFKQNHSQNLDYVAEVYPNLPETDIKLIAFYLPQFHTIPENDKWWGKGFTEWTNVSKALPQFEGHYQPHLPGELGFYDLRRVEIQKRQAELAKQYGVYGFCFYFYWFNGKTLLEEPIKNFTENIDFPFCLAWANEDWTRAWDGLNSEVLIEQRHSIEADSEYIQYIAKYLRNKHYIRIDNKPLVIVYHATLLKKPKIIAAKWRTWCQDNGVGEIYLACVHSRDTPDPKDIGFDAAIEFPPNLFALGDIKSQHTVFNPEYDAIVSSYEELVQAAQDYVAPQYKKFRGVCPSWDNEARRPGAGRTLAYSTPVKFKQWLKMIYRFTHNYFMPHERLVFINAWNEWAEGAYLEPDRKFGYAYLQNIADALNEYEQSKMNRKQIIYVSHDACFNGAQLLSLNIIKVLKIKFNYKVFCILKQGGELADEFSKYSKVYNLEENYKTSKQRKELVSDLYKSGITEAICNSTASGDITKILAENGIKTISLVHELPGIIAQMNLEKDALTLAQYAYKVIFPSTYVSNKFQTVAKLDKDKITILPQGLYKHNVYSDNKDEAREALRRMFCLPKNTIIVLGVGYGDHRKGTDLFVQVADIVTKAQNNVSFIWLGDVAPDIKKIISWDLKINKKLMFPGPSHDVGVYYAGADILLLPSREDPFPSVVLEAMAVNVPVIGFENAGGFSDIITKDTGALVPFLDVEAMAQKVLDLIADRKRLERLGANGRNLIESKFNFSNYVYKLLKILGNNYEKISVIVPNYNYGKYLKQRLKTILEQTYPIYEIIFLDDASTDNSMEVAETCLRDVPNTKIVRNKVNSGSVFKQWFKGIQMARGDYIWIAEADDLCEDSFLQSLMSRFDEDQTVALGYSQSKQMDERGEILANNYFDYTNDISKTKWQTDYVRSGKSEIADTLAVKNTIPNVSAVLFKKPENLETFNGMFDFKVAGDWLFYVLLLNIGGQIAYVSDSLNYHRRHVTSVTNSENNDRHYNEVVAMQDYIVAHFEVSDATKKKIAAYREHLQIFFYNKKDGS